MERLLDRIQFATPIYTYTYPNTANVITYHAVTPIMPIEQCKQLTGDKVG